MRARSWALAIALLLGLPNACAYLNATVQGSAIVVDWHGPDAGVLTTHLDTSPVTRLGYGQVDVFSKHSTYDTSLYPGIHIARTITLQNRESADQFVACGNFTIVENSSSMFQCRWDFASRGDARADWSGEIWVTVYDGLDMIFTGFTMTSSDAKDEERNSEWILQLEARDGFFELDGELEAAHHGTSENFGWQYDDTGNGMGQVLIVYGGPGPDPLDPSTWSGFNHDPRYLKAFKSENDLNQDGQSILASAIYEFVTDYWPGTFRDNRQFYDSGTIDYTLNSSTAAKGVWKGWDHLRGAYVVRATNDAASINFDGHDGTRYSPTIMVENIDCYRTIDVLNGTDKLEEGRDYILHRNPSSWRCYVVLLQMNGSPQTITIKRGTDVTPPTASLHKRTLSTVWNHTHVGLSARIWDISGVREVAFWHNGSGLMKRYVNGIEENSGTYSYWLTSDNYSFGQTIAWYFEAVDDSPGRNRGTGPVQTFRVPDYRELEIGAIYLCPPDGVALGQDFGHENYHQKFRNILRGQGYPFEMYYTWNITLDALAKHPVLLIASEMTQDSAWDHRQYNETDPAFGAVIREYLRHGCGNIIFLNPAAIWQFTDILGIRGEWFEIYGLNQGAYADRVQLVVQEALPGITPEAGTMTNLTDGGWGNDNHVGEGWFLLNTSTGSWGRSHMFIRIIVQLDGESYWMPLGYWDVGPARLWLVLPKWTTRGEDIIGEPHDGQTSWVFRLLEYALEDLTRGLSAKTMPFMERHGGVAYALNGLRAYMTEEEQESWIDVLTSIEKTREATGSPESLYIGAIPLCAPLRPDLLSHGGYFWSDDCYNDTGIEWDANLVTGLGPGYTKWFTGGSAEYNARAMNWIINGSAKFIMLYMDEAGSYFFKIDTDEDLDFAEEREFTMYEDHKVHLYVSNVIVTATIRGVLWEGHRNMPWSLMLMDDITNQINRTLLNFINERDWIKVGIHYPWMAAKPSGSHWGRYLDRTGMWSQGDAYELSRQYFYGGLTALYMVIDEDQVEGAFTPSEHTIDGDYMEGFADAGMVVHISNWQAIFGPERYENPNASQWYYNMYRGQEGGFGPSNWIPIVDVSGIAARNLGIDIDSGGTSFYPEAASDLQWMNENGWLTDYSDRSVEVVSVMDAFDYWSSTSWMLSRGSSMMINGTAIRIAFTGSDDMNGLTWMVPARNRTGHSLEALYLDGTEVLPDLTRDGYCYLTIDRAAGRHLIEAIYGTPPAQTDPFDSEPPDLNITVGSVGNAIRWMITDLEDLGGHFTLLRNGAQIRYGDWVSQGELVQPIDGLAQGEYDFELVYWDSRSPRLSDEVSVHVNPIVEAGGLLPVLSMAFGLILARSRQGRSAPASSAVVSKEPGLQPLV